MSHIFITGDLHGHMDFGKLIRFSKSKDGKALNKQDFLIILGDFGLIFNCFEPSNSELKYLEWLDKEAPWTTLFLDGNHENFDRLDNYGLYPLKDFYGGQVSKINNSVFHLLRGQSYLINDILFLVMGGADSIDKHLRTPHYNWWIQEQITHPQITKAINDYKNVKFDFILTHCAPVSYVDRLYLSNLLPPGPKNINSSEKQLEKLEKHIHYKKWFCGHYHCEYDSPKFQTIYNKIIELPSPDSFY